MGQRSVATHGTMTPEGAQPTGDSPRLPWLMRFPNTAFGISLGLAGSSPMWNAIANTPFTRSVLGDFASWVNWVVWVLACVVHVLIIAVYTAKVGCHPSVVRREWNDGVRGAMSTSYLGPSP